MKLNGFTELGNTLQSNIQNVARITNTISTELGKINSDFSLTTDSFTVPIPKGDYMVDISLTSNHGMTIDGAGQHGGHESGNGSHTHTVKPRCLQAGDRVLVAKAGTERIVVAVVTSSNNI